MGVLMPLKKDSIVKKTAKKVSSFEVNDRAFKLKKVAAHMAAAALLSVVATQATAQVALSTGLSGNLDGLVRSESGLGGYLITGDSRFSGATSNVTFGTTDSQSLVHNFNTTGGAGSGGGAGLGGAFFVDAGATLTVINTDFKSNRVQGGAGGSAPAIGFYDQTLNITGASVDLPSILVTGQPTASGSPLLTYSAGQYSFDTLSVNSDSAAMIKKDSLAVFDVYGSTAKVANINSQFVQFAAPVVVTDVLSLSKSNGSTTGFTSVGGTVNVNYLFNTSYVNPNGGDTSDAYYQVDSVEDIPGLKNVSIGTKLVARDANGIRQIATVTGVTYFTNEDDAAANGGHGANQQLRGKVKSITLDTPVTANFSEIAALDFLKAPAFKATQFYTNTDRTQVTVTSTLGTFVPGMTVSWEANGETRTAKVTSVAGRTLTLDSALPQGVTEFKAVENPVVGPNQISVPNASGKFAVGQAVFVPGEGGIVFEGTVQSIVGNVVTVVPRTSGNLTDYYNPSIGLALKLAAADVGSNGMSVTVPFNTAGKSAASIQALLTGRTVEGGAFADGTTVTGVTVLDGKVTLNLSQAANTNAVDYFRLYSPLKVGGSMNNLAAPAGSTGATASNGYSANFVSSFFNDSEGVDGTNGAPASAATTGAGRNGGNGGNGSMGLPVNFWLIYDLTAAIFSIKTATIDVGAAAADMAEAVTPDPVVGLAVELPDPAKIAAAALNVTKASIDLAFAITDTVLATANLTWWAAQLGQGLAGLGGAGGDGGGASGGTDFFGGGAGGAGGNGGDGATPISDGGNGGSGGSGGSGGFGAGGGQGGAGGTAGANGNAVAGDPGAGGVAGFAAGSGADGDGMYGGGGDGLGGAIFVRKGGSLLIQGNALFELNYAAGGSTSSQFGEAGYSAGTDLFMMKGSNVSLEPGLGKVIRFEGTIADDSLATSDGYENASGAGADITIKGNGGLVVFNGANTYSGHTILEGATLTALVGTGVHNDSLIRFNGSGGMTPNVNPNSVNFNTVTSTMSLASVGTFLLQEDYVRRAGMDPAETAWTGTGGFASALTEGVVVNLGKLDESGRGQQLVWGRDGFFVPYDDGAGSSGVLTFGSEQSNGAVRFTNNVDLNNMVGRVAVYNTGTFEQSHATLSGRWGNASGTSSALIVGDSSEGSPYNGYLFMTGENSLDSLFVAGGVLSTYNASGTAGKLFKATADAVVLADKNNEGASSHLQLFSDESLRNMTVLGGGVLTVTKSLTATGNFLNLGSVHILGNRTSELPEGALAGLELGYLPSDFAAWNGTLDLTGQFANYGLVNQTGSVNAGTLENNGFWSALGNINVVGNIHNTSDATMISAGRVTTGVAGDIRNDGYWEQVGNLTAGKDLLNTAGAQMNVTGNISVAGNLANADEAVLTVSGSNHRVGGDLTNAVAAAISVTGDTEIAGNLTNAATGVLTVTGNTQIGYNLTNSGRLSLTGSSHVVGGSLNNTENALMSLTGSTEVVGHLTNAAAAELEMSGATHQIGGDLSNGLNALLIATGNTQVGNNLTNNGRLRLTGTSHSVGGSLINAENALMSITGNTEVVGSLTNAAAAQLMMSGNSHYVGGSLINAENASMSLTGNMEVAGDLTNAAAAELTISGTSHYVGGNLSNAENALMSLTGNTEVAGNLSNAATGNLTITGTTHRVGGNLSNGEFALLTVTGDTQVDNNLTNSGRLSLTGNTQIGNNLSNSGRLIQTGDTTVVGRITNDGVWTFGTNALLKSNDLAGTGDFCLSSNLDCATGAAKTLTLELASASAFDGVFKGDGSLQKTGSGTLILSSAQTFTGGLQINAGTIDARSTMADALDISVGAAGTYIARGSDTIRSITNDGHTVLNSLNQQAQETLWATNGLVNNGRLQISGDRVLLLGSLETPSGLTGSAGGDIQLAAGAKLTLVQNADTAYSGKITRGDAASAFVKNGPGTLTISNNLDVKNVTIDGGTLALNNANILSSDADVTVNSLGKLALVVGDQSVNRLIGAGQVDLGSNNLNVENGGEFQGTITGTGLVVVDAGTFTINNIDATAGFDVKSGSTANVRGLLKAKDLMVQSGATLSLGASGQARGAVEVTDRVEVSGALEGSGTIIGPTIIKTGGDLRPGYSPGVLDFANGLTLDAGSTTTMEIFNANPAGVAGVDFDRVNIQGPFQISDSAKLDIAQWGAGSMALGLGETIKLFNFAPGAVKGVFGEATTDTGLSVFNLATGSVVGLGARTLADVASVAVTDNEKAIYNGLNVSTQGNVAQFYGGLFIEKLTQAMAAGQSTRAVFNAYNPESYMSLSDVGQEAAQLSLPTWKADFNGKDQFIAFAGNSSKATKQDASRQAFGLRADNISVGVARDLGNQKSVLFTLGNVNARTSSATLNSSGQGFNAAAVLMGSFDAIPSGAWHVGVSHSSMNLSGVRQNLNGNAQFDKVGVRTTQLDFGLESKHNFDSAYLMGRTSFAMGSTHRDAINERGLVNSLDTMSVDAGSHSYKLWTIGMELGTQLTSATSVFGALSYQSGNLNKNTLTAGFDGNQARFDVSANSAMASNSKVMTGFRHKSAGGTVFQASIGAVRSWESKTDLIGNVNLMVPF